MGKKETITEVIDNKYIYTNFNIQRYIYIYIYYDLTKFRYVKLINVNNNIIYYVPSHKTPGWRLYSCSVLISYTYSISLWHTHVHNWYVTWVLAHVHNYTPVIPPPPYTTTHLSYPTLPTHIQIYTYTKYIYYMYTHTHIYMAYAWSTFWGVGIDQWLEHQTCDWKVTGPNPCRSSRINLFSRINFLCWLLFRYPFHPCST